MSTEFPAEASASAQAKFLGGPLNGVVVAVAEIRCPLRTGSQEDPPWIWMVPPQKHWAQQDRNMEVVAHGTPLPEGAVPVPLHPYRCVVPDAGQAGHTLEFHDALADGSYYRSQLEASVKDEPPYPALPRERYRERIADFAARVRAATLDPAAEVDLLLWTRDERGKMPWPIRNDVRPSSTIRAAPGTPLYALGVAMYLDAICQNIERFIMDTPAGFNVLVDGPPYPVEVLDFSLEITPP